MKLRTSQLNRILLFARGYMRFYQNMYLVYVTVEHTELECFHC